MDHGKQRLCTTWAERILWWPAWRFFKGQFDFLNSREVGLPRARCAETLLQAPDSGLSHKAGHAESLFAGTKPGSLWPIDTI